MLTEKQLDIFTVFAKYPFKERTRQEIKNLAKEKSNNALSIAFSQFKEEDLLIEKKVGKSSLYTLNLENDLVYHYIALSNQKRLKKIVKTSIEHIKEEVTKTTPFFSIVVFGSYSIQKEKKDSDLDVAIFIENKDVVKEISRSLKDAELKSVLKLDAHVITRSDMVEMLINDEENLGKQIARKHMAVYNHQLFYDLIKEGMKHGFRL
ncbi:MAG: nucleotidyltransferase domain-containing protein [Nanoarchaeota archaeon]|nr:nucleotidyltransferase domain-containing protein [Nanoarchaeota archaeon]